MKLFIIITVLGLLCVAAELYLSPMGYEDETGFHFGKPPIDKDEKPDSL